MNICMAGACGRMGRTIMNLAAAQGHRVTGAVDIDSLAGIEIPLGDGSQIVKVTSDLASVLAPSDVVIDFTLADVCVANTELAARAGKPAVIGTTGIDDAGRSTIAKAAQSIPVVLAPNMSVGVNLLFKLTSEVASILGLDYNVEIVETHHNQKADSPSGTAVRLAERAAEALGLQYPAHAVHGREGMVGQRPQREIGVHALRGGDVVGEHTVSFIGRGETIELRHRAHNRDNFAIGAIRAAAFAVEAKPGLYDMQDVLGLK
jgi:4-hydroxy-tetrahydrodipicolinate reductase